MSRAKIYLRNLTANWVGYGLNLAIMFAMSPFVVHQLGDEKYGVWSLMVTMTGYLGLVEIGTRGGLGRFINYYLGRDEFDNLNGTINTGLVIFLVIGVILLVTSAVLIFVLGNLFPKIPPEILPDARIILGLIALNVWFSFFNAVFRQIITAFERFELVNLADLLVLVVRSGSTVVALLYGYDLLALGIIHTSAGFLGLLTVYVMAMKIYPRLTLDLSLASRAHFKELFGFSAWAFVGNVSYRLLYSADNIVIGILLGPKWLTYYSIGGMLLYRSREFISQAANIFAPKMIQDCATNNLQSLQSKFLRGSNLTMGVSILLYVGLLVFGREFIILWMGEKFEISYTVLAILTASSFFPAAFQVGVPVYAGMHRVKLSAMLVLSQGLANLGLTLFLVMNMKLGIEGVAWGSFCPRIIWAFLSGFMIMQMIDLRILNFLKNAIWWLILAGSFFCLCLFIDDYFMTISWFTFIVKVVTASVFYLPICWLCLLKKDEKQKCYLFLKKKLFN